MSDKYYIGIDVGGTKIATSLVTSSGKILSQGRFSTPPKAGPKEILNAIGLLIKEIYVEQSRAFRHLAGIGIGVPGIVDIDQDRVLNTPNINLSGFALGSALKKRYKVKIRVGNDVNLGLLGEQWLGSARGINNVISLFLGTGIGGGIIVDGKLFLGAHGSAAEIGHMMMAPQGPYCSCGNRGCLEALASRWAIERDIRQALRNKEKSLITKLSNGKFNVIKSKMLKKCLKAKDPVVAGIMKKSAKTIGQACITINHIFNPQMIVLGGGVMEACGEFILPIIEKEMYSDKFFSKSHMPRIVEAKLGDDAVILGAVALVRNH